jgi:hypothetical protein
LRRLKLIGATQQLDFTYGVKIEKCSFLPGLSGATKNMEDDTQKDEKKRALLSQ